METATLEKAPEQVIKRKAGRPAKKVKHNDVEKSYQFRKQDNGKFKVFGIGTDVLLEGFEDKEFGSPLEGGRFMSSILKSAEKTAESVPFKIPIIEGKEPIIIVSDRERYFETTIREHGEDKRISEPITDGINTTYHVAMGKKVVLPESVINTAKEAVYTVMSTDKDETTQKITHRKIETPRFSVEIHREVASDEARKWLKEQKKYNISVFK